MYFWRDACDYNHYKSDNIPFPRDSGKESYSCNILSQKVFPQNKPNEFLYNLYTGFSLSQYENMESYMITVNWDKTSPLACRYITT